MKHSAKISKTPFIISKLFILSTALLAFESFANVSIGLSGFSSDTNLDLEKQTSTRGSASLSFALGPFISVGISGTRAQAKSDGQQYINDTYFAFSSKVIETKYDVRGTLILYQGIVSPFVFGGVANRYVKQTKVFPAVTNGVFHDEQVDLKTPTYGFGFGVNLSRQFSLKITQTYTHVKIATLVLDSAEASGMKVDELNAVDSYAQVGITYNL